MKWLTNSWWRFVFWWKQRTGWLNLGQVLMVTGTVIEVDPPGTDGDGNFDLLLDPGQDQWITGFGGRLTSASPDLPPSLHCEVEPWASDELMGTFGRLKVGDRVRVTGSWGFDGVHLGIPEWLEVLAALVRHQPNVKEGWFECHPVTELEILTETTP